MGQLSRNHLAIIPFPASAITSVRSVPRSLTRSSCQALTRRCELSWSYCQSAVHDAQTE